MQFFKNYTQRSKGGGAIYNQGDLRLLDVAISDNKARPDTPVPLTLGGAVLNDKRLVLDLAGRGVSVFPLVDTRTWALTRDPEVLKTLALIDVANAPKEALLIPEVLQLAVDSPDVDPTDSMFDTLQRKAILLSMPYESFEPVVRLIEQAADDPGVLAIKIILYRTSRNSPIVDALNRASMMGAPGLRNLRAGALNALYALAPLRRTMMRAGLGVR